MNITGYGNGWDALAFAIVGATLWTAWELATGRLVIAFDPFRFTSESADEERGARIRKNNTYVFTVWEDFRNFLTTHYPDMEQERIESFQHFWQQEVMKCAPGEAMYFIATPRGVNAVVA